MKGTFGCFAQFYLTRLAGKSRLSKVSPNRISCLVVLLSVKACLTPQCKHFDFYNTKCSSWSGDHSIMHRCQRSSKSAPYSMRCACRSPCRCERADLALLVGQGFSCLEKRVRGCLIALLVFFREDMRRTLLIIKIGLHRLQDSQE